jgi:hypothetical protein
MRPLPTATSFNVCVPGVSVRANTTRRTIVLLVFSLTVLTSTPSTYTLNEPRLALVGETTPTARPENVYVALALAALV